jgi:hypothetical protein
LILLSGAASVVTPTIPLVPIAPSNNRIALDGDSRTISSGVTNLGGYASWALARCNHRIDIIPGENYAVGGQNSADILARVAATGASTAATVFAIFGRNDISAGLTVQQSIDNYTAWIDALHNTYGKFVVMGNELPDSGWVGSQITDHLARKAWLEDPARTVTWPNFRCIDTFNPMLKSGTQCTWKDNYASDNTHMDGLGPRALGESIGDSFKSLFPIASYPTLIDLPDDATADLYNAGTNPFGCLNVNFMMTGTTGTKSGTTIYTGNVPTSWDITSSFTGLTCACSQSTDSDGFAQLVMHISGTIPGASNAVLTLRQITGAVANVSAGDKLRTMGRFMVDAGAVGLRGLGVQAFATGNNGVVQNYSALAFNGSSSSMTYDGPAIDLAIASPIITAPADWGTMTARGIRTQASLNLLNGGALIDLTARVSRFGMKKAA